MAFVWTIIFIIVAIVFIWWVLGQAKILDQAHGGGAHGQEQHHGDGEHSADPHYHQESVATAPSTDREPDDLTAIRGIGAIIAPKLHALGITTFEHLAHLTPAEIENINSKLDFKGRVEREKWVEQAQAILSRRE